MFIVGINRGAWGWGDQPLKSFIVSAFVAASHTNASGPDQWQETLAGAVVAFGAVGFDDSANLGNKGEDIIDVDTDKEGDQTCD